MYTILVGHPATGKTRTIMTGRKLLSEIADFHISPTSMTFSSLVDRLLLAKRTIIRMPEPPYEFNSMTLCTDEWGAFMHQYDDEMVAGLTTFWDVVIPYEQWRRGKDLRILIKAPQLSIMAGSTPSNLLKFMPEGAWDQGFTSRLMLIFSDERPKIENVFKIKTREQPKEMIHDIKVIAAQFGEFQTEDAFEDAVTNWRQLGCPPAPNHPKLTHYNARRWTHLLKLSMVANIDRDGHLILTTADFNKAMGWLLEAESNMPDLFAAGTVGADAKAMEEILHHINALAVYDKAGNPKPVPEHRIVKFAGDRIPAHSVLRVLEIMERSGMIHMAGVDKTTGLRTFLPTARAD